MSAGRRRASNTGLTGRIRDALAYGPLSAEELVARLGVEKRRITQMIYQLLDEARGFRVVNHNGEVKYALIFPPHQSRGKPGRKRAGSGVIAGRIMVGRGSVWGAGLV